MRTMFGRTLWPLLVVVLAACSNGSGSLEDQQAPPPPSQPAQSGLTIGGSVVGLAGGRVVLQNNGTGDLGVESDGAFTFAGTASTGAGYNVTVLTQPTTPAQTCTVANGTGTFASANITNVVVTCSTAPRYTIRVTVTGLSSAGLVLLSNDADSLPINTNGSYLFSTALTSGTPYTVRVGTQPTGQNCVVTNPTGTIANANVTNVEVACAANQFTVGFNVTGLQGKGLVLRLNGANDFAVMTNGKFDFPVALAPNTAYVVSVKADSPVTKPAQDCVVTNGEGTVVNANVSTASVTCTTKKFAVRGAVSGLAGSGLVLQLNGANDLPIMGNGSFGFPPIADGTAFEVTIKTQPTSPLQTCTLEKPKGTLDGADYTLVRVNCATKTYTIGGTVIDLARGSSVTLQNNGADNLTIGQNGKFKFATPVASGGAYTVTVLTHPTSPAQNCDISNGSGTVSQDANIDDVIVRCSTKEFTIGGTVNNLVGSGLELRNGTDRVTVNPPGTFTFPRTVRSGANYNVEVHRDPTTPQQTCAMQGTTGIGTVGDANVTSVVVDCVTTTFTIGGNVSGLRSGGLILQNNGADNLLIGSDGSFTFATGLPQGSPYGVTVFKQPDDPTNICFVASPGNAGTIGTANITNVQVSCF